MESMRKNEIIKLEDKDLQLRYFLGGLKLSNDGHLCHYWTCDINCSCTPVLDDNNFKEVKDFVKKHHLTNERFLHLTHNYLKAAIMKYNGEYSPFFKELENLLKPYNFLHTNKGEIPDSDYGVKELENLLENKSINNNIYYILNKYKFTPEDFICFAKTSINYNYYSLEYISCNNDEFGLDIKSIIEKNGLKVPREYIKKYRENYNANKEDTKLVMKIKEEQIKYLELMKILLERNPNLVNELVSQELDELGYSSRREIKKLLKNKKTN